jgi:DNA-binding transcriptional ArsR family regulator
MNSSRRRRKPAKPEFAPLEQLAPGQPFNPNRLFKGRSAREKILSFPKLAPGAKLVWLMLADKVYLRGYTEHTERELAGFVSLSRRQFGRHLRKLKKLHLVHSEPNIGSSNLTWLLFHSLFAFCTPLPSRISDVGVPADVREDSPHMWRGNNRVLRKLQGTGPATFAVGTSNGGSSDDPGEEWANPSAEAQAGREVPITERSSPLRVSKDARAFWYSLSPHEKGRRFSLAEAAAERVLHFRQYVDNPDRNISHQARHEVERYANELRSLGFYLTSPNGQEKPWTKNSQKKN